MRQITFDQNMTMAAIIVVSGFIGIELLRLVIQHTFQRFTNSPYVTRSEFEEFKQQRIQACDQNRQHCEQMNSLSSNSRDKELESVKKELESVNHEISVIKEILLILAQRAGVRESDLKRLVK